jgi:hypothetical protein
MPTLRPHEQMQQFQQRHQQNVAYHTETATTGMTLLVVSNLTNHNSRMKFRNVKCQGHLTFGRCTLIFSYKMARKERWEENFLTVNEKKE